MSSEEAVKLDTAYQVYEAVRRDYQAGRVSRRAWLEAKHKYKQAVSAYSAVSKNTC